MLESFRKGQRWLTLAIVSVVGGVFVFFMGVGGGLQPGRPSGNAVVELGEIRYQVSDYQRLRSQQESVYREQLGDNFDADTIGPFLDSRALRSIIDGAILADSAKAIGLRVTREEIQRLVRQSPAFRDDAGRFDRDRFVNYANYEYGNQRAFLDIMSNELLRQKMVGLIYGLASVSEAEARDTALYELEQVRIAYVALSRTQVEEADALDDAGVAAYLEAHRGPLEADYQARIAEFQTPEQVRARHILVRFDTAEPSTLESARTRASALRERIVAGEAFEEVARAESEDPGSKERGGDLGFFPRGVNAPALEDAAFALAPGDLSEIVKSDFGFHIVRVEEHQPASTRPFEVVATELAAAAAEREAAEARAVSLAEKLRAAIAAGQSLESAARTEGLTLERTTLLSRRPDGFIPGLGAAAKVLDAAFALDAESPTPAQVFELEDQLVLIQLLERTAPDAAELDQLAEDRRPNLLMAKRNKMIEDWINQRREELETTGRLLVNADLVISGS